MRVVSPVLVAACLSLPIHGPARAQTGTETGETTVSASPLQPFGDLRLRGDAADALLPDSTDPRTSMSRVRSFARGGLRWAPSARGGGLRVEVGAKAALASDTNADSHLDADNEKSDGLSLDRASVEWIAGDRVALVAGKAPLALALTPMAWDEDLRPIGASLVLKQTVAPEVAVRLAGGYWAATHLRTDDVRLAAGQIRLEADWGIDLGVAYLVFMNVDSLIAAGLNRQNNLVDDGHGGRRYMSRFHLVDIQIGARAVNKPIPMAARIDLVMNPTAIPAPSYLQPGGAVSTTALRNMLTVGDMLAPRHVEAGYAFEMVDPDAVVGAFTSDDWWFHSAAVGHSVWLGAGLPGAAHARLSLFLQRRSDVSQWSRRLLLDVVWARL